MEFGKRILVLIISSGYFRVMTSLLWALISSWVKQMAPWFCLLLNLFVNPLLLYSRKKMLPLYIG
jgi:hypothetical protein